MIWADRAAIGCFVLLAMFFGFACLVGNGPGATVENFLAALVRGAAPASLVIRVCLRVVDFVAIAPIRRARR